MNEQRIKEAVYVALFGGAFYYAAKALKTNATAALIIGTAIGRILSN